jgi:N-acyl homoserine lactone hydrolase
MRYAVHIIHVATFTNVNYSFLVKSATVERKITCPSLSFLIRAKESRPEKLIIVDTGPSHRSPSIPPNEKLRVHARQAYRKVFGQLSIGFKDITDVILTHLHWDHIENIGLFPRARLHLQREELQECIAPVGPNYYDLKDTINLISKHFHRLNFLDGDAMIAEGLEVWKVGGHTRGSQIVRVDTDLGKVIIAGDVMNLYDNVNSPSKKENDTQSWKRAVDLTMKGCDILLPGHDMRVVERYHVIG